MKNVKSIDTKAIDVAVSVLTLGKSADEKARKQANKLLVSYLKNQNK